MKLPSRMRRGLITVAAGAVAIAVGVVAVPGGSASAAADKPIVLGFICDCTGPFASSIASSAPQIQAWADYTNAHGGLDGHHVTMIVKDDDANPGLAESQVQTLVQQDHIDALIDNTNIDSSFASYIESQHVPVIGNINTAAGYSNPDFFTQGETFNYAVSKVYPAEAKKGDAKKIAYFYCAEAASCQTANAELKKSIPTFGIQLVYTAEISAAAPNYTAECLAAKQAGATALLVGDASQIIAKVASDCATQGYTPTEIGNSSGVGEDWLTPDFNGAIFVAPDYPWFVHNSVTKDMFAAYKKYAPQVLSSPDYGAGATATWAQGVEVAQAVRLGDIGSTPTPAAILDGLYKFHGNNLEGFSGPLTFTKGKPSNNGCVFYGGVKDSKFVTPYGTQPFCYTTKVPPSGG